MLRFPVFSSEPQLEQDIARLVRHIREHWLRRYPDLETLDQVLCRQLQREAAIPLGGGGPWQLELAHQGRTRFAIVPAMNVGSGDEIEALGGPFFVSLDPIQPGRSNRWLRDNVIAPGARLSRGMSNLKLRLPTSKELWLATPFIASWDKPGAKPRFLLAGSDKVSKARALNCETGEGYYMCRPRRRPSGNGSPLCVYLPGEPLE
jgi:hypothetical protein